MFALVKGNVETAKKSAQERGLHVVEVLEMSSNTIRIRVLDAIDDVPTNADGIIRKWFGEPANTIDGYGYPPGSCIHFWE